MNILKFSIIFLAIFLIGFTSCTKDDDQITTPKIKLLTNKTKQVIGESFITINEVQRPVIEFDISTENDDNAILFFLNETEFVAVSFTGEELDWTSVTAFLDNKFYSGENFEETIISSTTVSGTGTVNDDNANTKSLTILFDQTSFGAGASTIDVVGDVAKINGTLGSLTYNQILDLNTNNQNVHTILFEVVEGSVNDEINVETGRLIREAGYTTEVTSTSEIYSGGVDLFCSGVKRVIEDGATIGVHSWCCGDDGEGASDIPENDFQHNSQISYFTEMLGDPNGRDFYFFTINAASFDGIHKMSNAEINQYMLRSE